MISEANPTHPVPEALRDTTRRWRSAGQPAQETPWSRAAWQSAFPQYADYLVSLPERVTRSDVIERCRDAHGSPEAAVRGFLAAMVWGYGPVGYGPYRTARVLSENPGAARVLADVAGRARAEGGPAAFEWLARHRLRYLGVAFATKYLFFCAVDGDGEPAAVLDRVVRGWLARQAGWQPRLDWQVEDYRRYVTVITDWASTLDLSPSDIEWLIFADASGAAGRWSPGASPEEPAPPAPAEPLQLGEEEREVLDALDDAEEAFAALQPTANPADAEDFHHLLRQLRRVVLARPRP